MQNFYNDAELPADVIFLNNVPFLRSISKYSYYRTVTSVGKFKCMLLKSQMKNVIRSYYVGGLRIVVIGMDIKFKALNDRNECGVEFNVVSREEHDPKIEHCHRVAKERFRCFSIITPFDNFPRIMVAQLMITSVIYINAFVWERASRKILPPLTIMKGTALDFNIHFIFIFGEFFQTFEGTENTM